MASFDENVLVNLNDLPDHILVQIFKCNKWDTDTLLVSRLVCQKWNNLIEGYHLLSHLWFKFEFIDLYKGHEFVRAVLDDAVEVRNLQLTCCEYYWGLEVFMKKLAKTVRHLDITIENIDVIWMSFFTNAKNLTTLVLNTEMYDSPQSAIDILQTNTNSHPFLKKITFIGAIEEYVLDYFRNTAINVESLNFYSDVRGSTEAIERMVFDRLATISNVKLHLPYVPESIFHILSSSPVMKLRNYECEAEISPGFEMFLSRQVNIEKLKMYTNSGNIRALQQLRKLTHLCLIINAPVKNWISLDITNDKCQLKLLQIIGNSNCSIVSTNLEQNLSVQILRLETTEDLTIHARTIRAVTENYPNLVSLNIRNCDVVALADISDKLVHLIELKICNDVTDVSFAGLMTEKIVNLCKLKVLVIRNFYDIFDDNYLKNKFKLPSLEVLNLAGSVQQVTFDGLLGIAINCPNIAVLNVRGVSLTSNSLNNLFDYMQKLENLHFLQD